MKQSPTPAKLPLREPIARPAPARQVFFVLAENPCPYLPGRRERKLITEIDGADPRSRFSRLSRAGFRRTQNFAYRPACSGCAACVPVRIAAREFSMSRSQRRVWRANRDIGLRLEPARATPEQYELFTRYIESRHGDGEMAGMTFAEYGGMLENSRIETEVAEFRDPLGQLVGACLLDWMADGPSAVYSFFDPDLGRRSLGTYMILWLVEAALGRGLPYAYLGYWIGASPKMAYKSRFRPLQAHGPGGWAALETGRAGRAGTGGELRADRTPVP